MPCQCEKAWTTIVRLGLPKYRCGKRKHGLNIGVSICHRHTLSTFSHWTWHHEPFPSRRNEDAIPVGNVQQTNHTNFIWAPEPSLLLGASAA